MLKKFLVYVFICFVSVVSLVPDSVVRGSDAAKECANTFFFDEEFVSNARIVASSFSLSNAREHLERITGIRPVMQEICLQDRCSERNKDYFRAYLLDYLKQLGYQNNEVFLEYDGEKYSLAVLEEFRAKLGDDHLKNLVMNRLNNPPSKGPKKSTKISRQKRTKKNKPQSISDIIIKTISFWEGDIDSRSKDEPNHEPSEPMTKDEMILPVELPAPLMEWLMLKELFFTDQKHAFRSSGPVNIVVEKLGKDTPSEFIELNAHYDTVYSGVPGADDNGSGTITLLEAVRILREVETKRSTRIIFADLEEQGFVGTKMHAEIANANKNEVVIGAMVLDMFGYYPKYKQNEEQKVFVLEAADSNHIKNKDRFERNRLFVNTIMEQASLFKRASMPRLSVEDAKPYTADHGPYWKYDIPSVLIAAEFKSPYITPGYHSKGDNIELYDWKFFGSIARQVLESFVRLAGVSSVGQVIRSRFQELESLNNTADQTKSSEEEAKRVASIKNRDWLGDEVKRIAAEEEEKKSWYSPSTYNYDDDSYYKRDYVTFSPSEEAEPEFRSVSKPVNIPMREPTESKASSTRKTQAEERAKQYEKLKQQFLKKLDSAFVEDWGVVESESSLHHQTSADIPLIDLSYIDPYYFSKPKDSVAYKANSSTYFGSKEKTTKEDHWFDDFIDSTIGIGFYYESYMIRIGRLAIVKSRINGAWMIADYSPQKYAESSYTWMTFIRSPRQVYKDIGPKIIEQLFELSPSTLRLKNYDRDIYIPALVYMTVKEWSFKNSSELPDGSVEINFHSPQSKLLWYLSGQTLGDQKIEGLTEIFRNAGLFSYKVDSAL